MCIFPLLGILPRAYKILRIINAYFDESLACFNSKLFTDVTLMSTRCPRTVAFYSVYDHSDRKFQVIKIQKSMLALKSGNQFWSYQCLWLLNHMLAEKLVSFCQVEGDIMQISSMHTLQVITIHFTFITA